MIPINEKIVQNAAPELIAILFHRIVKTEINDWEDIKKPIFNTIVKYIKNSWFTFNDCAKTDTTKWGLMFDDGHESDHSIVLPTLLEFNVAATFFLVSNFVDKQGYLNWNQVREMQKYGMCIGSHGEDHLVLAEIDQKKAVLDMRNSKYTIEDKIGQAVEVFSFPFGSCNRRLIDLAYDVGYKYCCTSNPGSFYPRDTVIPRKAVHSKMNLRDINNLLVPSKATKIKDKMYFYLRAALKRTVGGKRYKTIRDNIYKKK